MQTEVLMVLDTVEHGIRNAADTDLETGSVGNLRGDVRADGGLDRGRFPEGHRKGGDIAKHRGRDLAFVDQAVAIQIRNVRAHLRDNDPRDLSRRNGNVSGDAEAAVAILVRQRAGDHRDVDRELPAAEHSGHFAEKERGHRAVSGRDMRPLVSADENAVDEEGILVFGLAERGRILVDVETGGDRHVAELGVAAGQGFLQ